MFTPRTMYLFKQISLFLLTIQSGYLFACPDDQYESLGVCWPKVGGAIGQAAEQLKKTRPCEALSVPCIDFGQETERVLREIQAQGGAPVLAGWITQSRNDAWNSGISPIPEHIRRQLNGFYDQDILKRTAYKIGDNGLLNLGRLAPLIGDARAITLIDVIVFKSPTDVNDPFLWVHELMHVKQYRDWGVYDFSIRYLRDPPHDRNPVENQAREAERAFRERQGQPSNENRSRPGIPEGAFKFGNRPPIYYSNGQGHYCWYDRMPDSPRWRDMSGRLSEYNMIYDGVCSAGGSRPAPHPDPNF